EGKAPAVFRVSEFIQIRRHQWNLAAEPNALNESQQPQLLVARRRSAGQSAEREDQQSYQHAQPAAPTFVKPAKSDGAPQLAGKTDPDKQADLLRIEMPFADDRGAAHRRW